MFVFDDFDCVCDYYWLGYVCDVCVWFCVVVDLCGWYGVGLYGVWYCCCVGWLEFWCVVVEFVGVWCVWCVVDCVCSVVDFG